MRGTDLRPQEAGLFAIVTVFVAITLNFVLFRAVPGDAVSRCAAGSAPPSSRRMQRKSSGLDRSKWEQYGLYVSNLARGDLGNSLRTQEPVMSALWEPIKNTLPMVALGTFFSIIFGIFTGVISAWRRGTAIDKTGALGQPRLLLDATAVARPVLVLFVAGALGLPTSGIADPTLGILSDPSAWDRLRRPAGAHGLARAHARARPLRRVHADRALGDARDARRGLRADRAREGALELATVWKHGFRNAMLPVITLVALSLGFIIGGSITIEYVFSYPGIGLQIVEAIDQRDYPILQGAFLLLSLSVIFFNLAADLLYFKLDPRVTE